MLSWALTFLILALVAGFLGFFGLAGLAAGIAKILLFAFLILFLISALSGALRGRAPPVSRDRGGNRIGFRRVGHGRAGIEMESRSPPIKKPSGVRSRFWGLCSNRIRCHRPLHAVDPFCFFFPLPNWVARTRSLSSDCAGDDDLFEKVQKPNLWAGS